MNVPVTTIPEGLDLVSANNVAREISERMIVCFYATDPNRVWLHHKHAHEGMARLAALFGCKLVPIQAEADAA